MVAERFGQSKRAWGGAVQRLMSGRGCLRLCQWHDRRWRGAHFSQETIAHRAAQRNFPPRARRLAEDKVGDALAPRKFDQRLGHLAAFQLDDLCAPFSACGFAASALTRAISFLLVGPGFAPDEAPAS